MNIFESLENLNVSEECFSSIMDIVESILSQIKKVYGDEDGSLVDSKKGQELRRKYNSVKDKQRTDDVEREGIDSAEAQEIRRLGRDTKNFIGMRKNKGRSYNERI